MLRTPRLSIVSALCLALPLAWAACSSSSDGSGLPASGDAGSNTNNGGDGDPASGDGDSNGNDDAGNGANGDGDSNGDGDVTGDGDTGNGGNGGAGGSSNGSGGMGPGLEQGDVNCLGAERMDLATAFYFGFHQICTSTSPKEGMFDDMQAQYVEGLCAAVNAGTVVDSCSDDNVVAYCAGDQYTAVGVLDELRRVYEGPVTPDAAHVARNAFAICGASPVYDLDDNLLTANCSGTVTAMVDDVLTDFSEKLICTFRTDGTQTTYFVRATQDPNSLESKELTLKIIKDGDEVISYFTEVNTLPVGYLEGATASGAFAFETDNTDLMVDITDYSDTGDGFAGTFSIGELRTGSNAVRQITDGVIDIQFTVE
jgi:hypothetical protein